MIILQTDSSISLCQPLGETLGTGSQLERMSGRTSLSAIRTMRWSKRTRPKMTLAIAADRNPERPFLVR